MRTIGERVLMLGVDPSGEPIAMRLDVEGNMPVSMRESTVGSSEVTPISASVTPVTLAPSRANRVGLAIYSEPGSSTLFLKIGSGVSTNLYTVRLFAGDFWEPMPAALADEVTGVWSPDATGRIMVTELLT